MFENYKRYFLFPTEVYGFAVKMTVRKSDIGMTPHDLNSDSVLSKMKRKRKNDK